MKTPGLKMMILTILFLHIFPEITYSQYFGRNKPGYKTFKYDALHTPNFEIYHYLKKDVYKRQVLHLATECNNKNHSAAFPEELPEWFIKLFTKEKDTVLDPFMGSGTTLFVANRMIRNSIGIDIVQEYYEMVKSQLQPVELYLFESEIEYERNKS